MLRDIFFILAVVVCIMITLSGGGDDGSPYLYKKWKYNLDATRYTNRKYPSLHERLPSPLVTDLNGDGKNDIVVATKAPSLVLLRPPDQQTDGKPTVLREVSLLSSTRSIGSRHPVSMRSGYLDPFRTTDHDSSSSGGENDGTNNNSRKQIIVVVLKSWTVLCFDHNLHLQWETSASRIQSVLGLGPLVHREVGITISSLSIVQGDRGVVIVGGSMMLRDGVNDGTFEISGDRVQEDTDGSDSKNYKEEVILQHQRDVYYEKVKRAEHFNYFAFDGQTGSVRWKHQAGPGLEQEDPGEDDIDVTSTNNGYRMTATDLRHMNTGGGGDGGGGDKQRDKSVMDWKEFRLSMLDELPHSWSERDDTELHLAHFSRDRHHRRKASWTSTLKSYGVNTVMNGGEKKVHGYSNGGVLPKDAMKRRWSSSGASRERKEESLHPNVVVAHTRKGIEILHVYTGKTVTRISMPEPRFGGGSGLYVDLNGDRVVDHVQAIPGVEQDSEEQQNNDMEDENDLSETIKQMGRNHGRSSHYNVPSCWVQTISGVPPLEKIWEGSLCNIGGNDESMMNPSKNHEVEESVRVVPPILSPHIHSNKEEVSSLKSKRSEAAIHPYDVTILASTGMMTKFNPLGHVLWRSMTDATWHQEPAKHRHTHHDIDAFLPSTVMMNLYSYLSSSKAKTIVLSSEVISEAEKTVKKTVSNSVDKNNKEQGHHHHHHHHHHHSSFETMSDSRRLLNKGQKIILGVGNKHMVLVSLENGKQKSRVQLDMPSTNKPVIGDYNNDGINDVVLVTKDSIIGYTMGITKRRRFLFLLLIFVLIMIFFLIFLQLFGLLDELETDHRQYRGRWREENSTNDYQRKSKRAMD